MISIEPEFVDDRPEQGVKGWAIAFDLPELTGSRRQVNWAIAIRENSLRAFVELAMRQGGPGSIWTRHWWDDDLKDELRRAVEELNNRLAPMLRETTASPDWINALGLDRDQKDPGVIIRLLIGGF